MLIPPFPRDLTVTTLPSYRVDWRGKSYLVCFRQPTGTPDAWSVWIDNVLVDAYAGPFPASTVAWAYLHAFLGEDGR